MPEMLLTHRGVVYPWQCDNMGHLNVAHYFLSEANPLV
jgi:acyl-CoA thioesterase FadM